ncbi:cardiomyopathy-associated protein 5-like isoform X3 [Adelges cooleyi]|uniref:cardiomyopathy-associated protein 5-like isoform X3 n=1 Tax=Adelges cooleyi TaxID=133065 RepID=UPI0021801EB1|nr:cardiomyopathy-associated protein 5-like isoform X3 [Adelges cooleyi]
MNFKNIFCLLEITFVTMLVINSAVDGMDGVHNEIQHPAKPSVHNEIHYSGKPTQHVPFRQPPNPGVHNEIQHPAKPSVHNEIQHPAKPTQHVPYRQPPNPGESKSSCCPTM